MQKDKKVKYKLNGERTGQRTRRPNINSNVKGIKRHNTKRRHIYYIVRGQSSRT